MDTYSYTEFAARERAERSEGEPGLSIEAKVRAFLAEANDTLHRIAIRQAGTQARLRWIDARAQYRAALEAL